MDHVAEILELLDRGRVGPATLATALVAARLFAVVRMVPFLGARRAPGPLHVALALVLALAIGPSVPVESVPAAPAVVLLAVKEVAVGLALGFLASLPFRFVEMSGVLADMSRSTSLSTTSMTGRDGSSPTGNLLFFASMAVFFLTPAHRAFYTGVLASFASVPVIPDAASLPATTGAVAMGAVAASAGLFASSLMICLPVLGSVLLADVVIGAAGRFVPHSGGTFTFMPLRSVVGMGALALSMTLLAPVLAELLYDSMSWLGLVWPR